MPGQMVELPHWPLVVMIPVGSVGMGTELLVLVLVLLLVELLVVLVVLVVLLLRVELVVEVLLVGLMVVEVVVATGRGHPQTPYAGWQSKPG